MKIIHLPIIAFLALILFTSCKKSNSGIAVRTVSATIDDTAFTFNDGFSLQVEDVGPIFGFEGGAVDTVKKNELSILVASDDSTKLKSKTYFETGDSTVEIQIEFEENGTVYRNGLTKIAPFEVSLGGPLQGTFSGKVYLGGDSTKAARTITNGKFNFQLY
jgi:hypothetical protein